MEPGERQLILVKHAMPEIEPGVRASAWTLSEAGRSACVPLAARLAEFSPGRVVTSFEPKAAETGTLTATALGLTVSTASGLHELDQGDTPFLATARWNALGESSFARPEERICGLERAVDASDRFAAAVEAVLDQHPAGGTVIVAHGRVIGLFVARTNVIDPFELWGQLGLPSFVVLDLPGFIVRTVVAQVD